MKSHKLPSLCFLLAAVFILSACSSVKIANIEKRRYRGGYHVQLKKKIQKTREIATVINESPEEGSPSASDKEPVRMAVKAEVKKVKEAIRSFKKDQNIEQFIASLDDVVKKVSVISTHKGLASAPVKSRKLSDANSPNDLPGVVLGLMGLIFAIVFLVLFLALALNIILVLAVAVIFAIVSVMLLKALNIITG